MSTGLCAQWAQGRRLDCRAAGDSLEAGFALGRHFMGYAIVWLINTIISLMIWFIIAQAILSWLVAFDVVNYRNRFVYSVGTFLDRITSPLLEPFRRMIPSLGGIDISPIVVILLLQFVTVLFNRSAAPALIAMLG